MTSLEFLENIISIAGRRIADIKAERECYCEAIATHSSHTDTLHSGKAQDMSSMANEIRVGFERERDLQFFKTELTKLYNIMESQEK